MLPAAALPIDEAYERGRALRKDVPRSAQGSFVAPERDAVAIIEDQNRDRLQELVPIRIGRMLQSPFAYFRGSAAVMAHDLGTESRTGVELVVCGDAHVSNFGLFASPERRVIFDLNDFDETSIGPWEWDVKRLVASAVVAGRQLGLTPEQVTATALAAARAYRTGLAQAFTVSALERFYFRVETDWLEARVNAESQQVVRRTIKKARRRTSEQVLAKITTTEDCGTPRIIDDFPIIRHDDALPVERVGKLYSDYRLSAQSDVTVLLQQFRVVDAVMRIVGVGSVGTRCFIALLLGRSNEALFIQIKEAPPSVLATYGGLAHSATLGMADKRVGGEGWRVVTGQRILQSVSDPFLGWVGFEGRDYYCRQFRDMKGSVELEALTPSELADYARLCGGVLARAHSQSPDAAVVRGYLGESARFDDAVTAWAHAYADQTERDYAALQQAVRCGRIAAEEGA